jgi:nicotinate dehydrogenase subunit A
VAERFKMTVNGAAVDIEADGNTPLVYVLRNDLGLKGTRFGCGQDQCGACHVLLDGHSVPACDTPLWAAAGKQVVTVEGLGTRGRPHRLQRAFIEEQAGQCGFCLSGILIAAAALLERTPSPTEADVRSALERHLCRCGAQNRAIRAVLRAAKAAP